MQRLISAMTAALLIAGPAVAKPATDRVGHLLRELADAPGPSGFEEAVRAVMVRELRPLSDTITYDGIGSVIAKQGSSGPKIMLDAHMDELGGVVRRVTPGGFLSMQMLGGWLDQALVDQRWVIIGSKGPVKAVTGIRDIHVVPADERGKVFPRESLYLDVGARNAAEVAALGIGPGDPVVPDAPFEVMAGGDRYLGKAWDDRVGCAVVIEALRRLRAQGHPNQLFVAATVQEEVGLRGARTAADLIKPDIGIAIEGGITGDSIGRNPEETQAVLAGGPGMFLYDSSTIPNRKLVALVDRVAAEANIPLQHDLVQGYGDDSAAIQATAGGVPTVNLVVVARYTHAHNGIIDRGDFDRMVTLVVGVIGKLDAAEVARLRSFEP
ncbi:M42 family metallopeptidase [Glacieibacterium megasporae]|uniref:M42 family metallopeptidase n=1 Tax=Glacieibacterium megasporae TaxID=2835787 RepID=UPI001C1E7CD0|nr:M42 family metallopeptidase [Polymorphobacter megasporae]UAJ08787.1 M42 family metallopeptidase [Polymorphobacter megasporae]